jgi:predicted ATPase
MSLKKVTLKNFRTCHEIELTNLGHLTVLMGRNGVGKTNILQGIEWMARTASGSNTVEMVPLSIGLLTIDAKNFFGQFIFSLDGINYRYTLELSFSDNATGILNRASQQPELQEQLERQKDIDNWQKVLTRTGETVSGAAGEQLAEIQKAMPMLPAIEALKPFGETKEDILPVLAYLRGVKYYSFDEATASSLKKSSLIVSDMEYKEWLSQAENLSSEKDSLVMRLLHMSIDRRDDFDELNQLLGAKGLGILSSIEISKGDINYVTYHFVSFQPGRGWEGVRKPTLPFEKLSSGTRRLIRILVSFFYDRNSLFLFEQPEDAIHAGLLRKLIDLLRGYDDKGQLIMTSHSSDLFNALKPEEVRLVTMERGATQVRALSESEMAGAKRFINEEGSLSDYLDMLETD